MGQTGHGLTLEKTAPSGAVLLWVMPCCAGHA